MSSTTKKKILLTGALYLLWIVLGQFGVLPMLLFSYFRNTHTILVPLSALLDLGIYVFFTPIAAAVIVEVIEKTFNRK